jgi:hypothetical protein
VIIRPIKQSVMILCVPWLATAAAFSASRVWAPALMLRSELKFSHGHASKTTRDVAFRNLLTEPATSHSNRTAPTKEKGLLISQQALYCFERRLCGFHYFFLVAFLVAFFTAFLAAFLTAFFAAFLGAAFFVAITNDSPFKQIGTALFLL